RAELTGQRGVEPRPRQMALVAVRGHVGSLRLEHSAVANGTVADADVAGPYLELGRRDYDRFAAGECKDLPALRVDHRHRTPCTGRQRVEGRDAGGAQIERQSEATCGREADPDAGEAARPDPDGERAAGDRGRTPP